MLFLKNVKDISAMTSFNFSSYTVPSVDCVSYSGTRKFQGRGKPGSGQGVNWPP